MSAKRISSVQKNKNIITKDLRGIPRLARTKDILQNKQHLQIYDEIRRSIQKNELHKQWQEEFSKDNAAYLYNSGCIYVSLIVLCNAHIASTKDHKFDEPRDFVACLKLGYTEASQGTVFLRTDSEFRLYDVAWTQPLAVLKGNNPARIESLLKKLLRKYQLKIRCSKEAKPAKYTQPTEFYAVDQNVIDIIRRVCEENNYTKIFTEECDLNKYNEIGDYEILSNTFLEHADHEISYELLSTEDNLTEEQSRHIKYYF